MKIAVDEIGIKNVFVIVLDGACKRTTRMINEATVDGEDKVLARIFGVRCSLHGTTLLIGDILRRYFASAVESSERIFRMIANHEASYQASKEAGVHQHC